MWIKSLVVIVLFYLFAVMQNSFFTHFNLFGAVPNLVITLFFLVVFFLPKNSSAEIILYSVFAGLFLDIFSYAYFGVSIILLLIIGLFAQKMKTMLQEKSNDTFPLVYFLPLFIISLLFYDFALSLCRDKFSFMQAISIFNFAISWEIVYNLLTAWLAFYIYKKFLQPKTADHQLRLFR